MKVAALKTDLPVVPASDSQRDGGRPSQSARLIELAEAKYRLAVTPEGEPFGLPIGGPPVVRMLRGGRSSLRAELADLFMTREGRPPSTSALAEALLVLEGRASSAPVVQPHVRVARIGGRIVLDLGDVAGRAVSIQPGKWQTLAQIPGDTVFRRTELTDALPVPDRDGDLDEAWSILNIAPEARPLLLAVLVSALLEDIPHPVVLLTGEQGSGKSTAARIVAQWVDPSPAPLRTAPESVEGWAVAAAGSWVVAVDNTSTISPWFSDALCRAVTGDGLVRRRLYTDTDLSVLAFKRVVLLTSIDPGALRGDLADRLVLVECERIPETERRLDGEVVATFKAAHARLLGALLDLTSHVLSELPRVDLPSLPRMADYAQVLAAVDRVLGTSGLDTYLNLGAQLAAELIDEDAVAAAVRTYVEDHGPWSGTARELYTALTPDPAPRNWPPDGQRLSARLRRAAPSLRTAGIETEAKRESGGHRRRLIVLDHVEGRDAGRDATTLLGLPASLPEDAGQPESRDARDSRDAISPSPSVQVSAKRAEVEREPGQRPKRPERPGSPTSEPPHRDGGDNP